MNKTQNVFLIVWLVGITGVLDKDHVNITPNKLLYSLTNAQLRQYKRGSLEWHQRRTMVWWRILQLNVSIPINVFLELYIKVESHWRSSYSRHFNYVNLNSRSSGPSLVLFSASRAFQPQAVLFRFHTSTEPNPSKQRWVFLLEMNIHTTKASPIIYKALAVWCTALR